MSRIVTQEMLNTFLDATVDLGKGDNYCPPYQTILDNWENLDYDFYFTDNQFVLEIDINYLAGNISRNTDITSKDSKNRILSWNNEVQLEGNWIRSYRYESPYPPYYSIYNLTEVDANDSYNSREGAVILTQEGSGKQLTINVKQSGQHPWITGNMISDSGIPARRSVNFSGPDGYPYNHLFTENINDMLIRVPKDLTTINFYSDIKFNEDDPDNSYITLYSPGTTNFKITSYRTSPSFRPIDSQLTTEDVGNGSIKIILKVTAYNNRTWINGGYVNVLFPDGTIKEDVELRVQEVAL